MNQFVLVFQPMGLLISGVGAEIQRSANNAPDQNRNKKKNPAEIGMELRHVVGLHSVQTPGQRQRDMLCSDVHTAGEPANPPKLFSIL